MSRIQFADAATLDRLTDIVFSEGKRIDGGPAASLGPWAGKRFWVAESGPFVLSVILGDEGYLTEVFASTADNLGRAVILHAIHRHGRPVRYHLGTRDTIDVILHCLALARADAA